MLDFEPKEVKVRTPRRGRTKSITVHGQKKDARNFPIGRLNNYDKEMKKHKGPLSMMSELESIKDEGENEDLSISSLMCSGVENKSILDRLDKSVS